MNYTDRVELCEDGLYRWYYDLSMQYMLPMTGITRLQQIRIRKEKQDS